LQAVEAVRQIALTPTANRIALTGHLGSHLQIRGAVWRSGSQDQPIAKRQGLGSGMGTHQRLQTGVFLRSEGYRARKRHGHGDYPYHTEGITQYKTHMAIILCVVMLKTYWHRIYEMDI
jgi:hypothetical protein